MRKKVWLSVGVVLSVVFGGYAQSAKSRWVDSVMSTLDETRKIGQVMVIPVQASADADNYAHLVRNHHIGGVVITQGSPVIALRLLNALQKEADIPLMVGMHAAEGIGTVLDSSLAMPPALLTAALQNDSLIYYEAKEIGRQLRLLGVQFAFSPNADLSRSFNDEAMLLQTYGNDPQRVANSAQLFMRGLQQAGVFPVATFFSNNTLQVTGFKRGAAQFNSQPDADKMLPLKKLIAAGVPGILCANQQDPIFKSRTSQIITGRKKKISLATPALYTGTYFKNELKFNGLVFSYLPEMRNGVRTFRSGDAEAMALLSGNDVLLFPDRISTAIRKLKKQLRRNPALQKQLDLSVRKILEAKYDAGLFRDVLRDEDNLVERLNSPTARLMQEDAFAQAITVVRNDQQTLPIQQLDNRTFGSLSIGAPAQNTFTKYLSRYAPFNHQAWQIAKDSATIGETLTLPDVLVVGIFPMASSFQTAYKKLLDDLAVKTTLIVVQFDAPSKLSIIDNQPTIVTAYADHQSLQRMVPQVIFGARTADARLPLLINESLKHGQGVTLEPIGRMEYTLPEAAGIDSRMLNKISNVVREAIDQKATPGCQVIVVRKGKVVFDRSFGWQTYDNRVPVNDETIYDLASITKVAATLQGVMFLYDHNLIDINRKASWYLPELRNTNKEDLVIKDILTHQAGLWPFVPFWVQTIKDSVWMPEYYSRTRTDEFPYQVAPHLFTNQAMKDSVWVWSLRSKMREKAARTPFNYTYSDIGMYIMHRMNERLLNQSQEEFLQQNLYEPLGANTLGYLPLNRFDVSRIAPTEKDKIFRRELLVGTVHDEGAALLGGTAGHAGLFGNANDLAKLGQMLLQKGYYGGQQFFNPGTVELFTFRQYENSRRGLGWDKPVLSDWNTPASAYASPKTYGHTGFTGTCIWVDPEFDLVYVFLSNRVYPTRDGNKLSGLNIRSRIQDIIYQSIFSYNQYQNLNVWKK